MAKSIGKARTTRVFIDEAQRCIDAALRLPVDAPDTDEALLRHVHPVEDNPAQWACSEQRASQADSVAVVAGPMGRPQA